MLLTNENYANVSHIYSTTCNTFVNTGISRKSSGWTTSKIVHNITQAHAALCSYRMAREPVPLRVNLKKLAHKTTTNWTGRYFCWEIKPSWSMSYLWASFNHLGNKISWQTFELGNKITIRGSVWSPRHGGRPANVTQRVHVHGSPNTHKHGRSHICMT